MGNEERVKKCLSFVNEGLQTSPPFSSSTFGRASQKRHASGFTLIEILIVVIILGILASLVIPRLAGRTEEARREAAKADIEGGIALALDLYEADNGRYPIQLEDLIHQPADAKKWKGPYLKKGLPKDPWGNSYRYQAPGSNNPSFYDLSSSGADGEDGAGDDITNWGND